MQCAIAWAAWSAFSTARGSLGLPPPPRLPPPACPRPQLKVLAVYGEHDGMRSDYARLEEGVPRAQFLLIPNAGHACYLDAPELFNRELLAFLENEILGGSGGGSSGGV